MVKAHGNATSQVSAASAVYIGGNAYSIIKKFRCGAKVDSPIIPSIHQTLSL